MFFSSRVIVHPLKERLSLGMKIAGICVVWSVAIGITLPYTMSLVHFEREAICVGIGDLSPTAKTIYIISWIVTGWGIPSFVIGLLYLKCILNLQIPMAGNNNNVAMNQRRAENKRVVKMFIIIVLLFFAFTTPYSVLYVAFNYLLIFHKDDVDINTAIKWNYALFVITTANSCFNPLIYAKLHKDVSKFVHKLCKCKKRKEPRPGDAYEMPEVAGGGIRSSNAAQAHNKVCTTTSFRNHAFSNVE